MKFAKIMVIIVIFVFAMSVSCAADTNNASISEDNSQMLLSLKNEMNDDTSENSILAQTNNDETLSAQKDSEILRANEEGNYSDLRDDIRNGGILTKSYYRYEEGDGETIVINSGGFTVNGNGAVIDMKGSTNMRAFYVIGSGVTFKNLTIKNANLKGSGGAIYFSGSGTVENCNFTANTATGTYLFGGAVYIGGTGDVSNCNFTGNTATGNGGAIWMSSGTVTNCNFTGNTAYSGGAVYISDTGTVSNCNFTGNTADGYGGAIWMSSGTVTNCNFSANTATANGGAVYFDYEGTVRNCNFTNNKATRSNSWGGAIYMVSGSVTNCNFTGNTATRGGAVYFAGTGNVTNCNFTGNKATGTLSYGGAVYFAYSTNPSTVRNCNFTGNTATGDGGAVYFVDSGDVINCNFTNNHATGGGAINMVSGSVENCNFTDNTAATGSAIYFYSTSAQKSVSNSIFLNNRANAKDLQVTKNEYNITIIFTGNNNILNAIYSRNDAEVSFSNVTYWGANGIVNTDTYKPSISNNAAGQSITVSIVINDKIDSNADYVTDENGTFVLNRYVGANYFIGVCHDTDSYYTEILNSTSKNTKFSVSVNNQTSNNRRVNITAKSNIPNEVLKGKLLFILPNSTQINANYTANGTWWAVHEFDDAGDYVINATYYGLDGVIINNATISIRYDACVDVNNKTLDLLVGDTFTIVANTTPDDLNVTYNPDGSGVVSVDNNGVVTALKNGAATIVVKVGGDGKYAENTTTVTVTVSKVPTEITVNPDSLNLFVGDETVIIANLTPPDAGNVTFTSSDDSVVTVDNQGNVIANAIGQAIITVSFAGDDKYAAAQNKTIVVNVGLKDACVSVNNNTLDLFVDDTFTIVANTTPKGLNVTYMSDNSGVVSVDESGVVTALKDGSASIIVSVGDDKIYAKNTTAIAVTVKKVNPNMDVSAGDITEGENATINIELPIDATGNVTTKVNHKTFSSLVENGKAIITIPDLVKGYYTLSVTYSGDSKYNPSIDYAIFKVNEDNLIVSAPDLTKYYSGSEKFVVNVTYARGVPVAGKDVKIRINGVTYSRTTDEEGIASLNINLDSKTYDVITLVDNIVIDSLVTILPTIDAEDVESKSKNIVFTATFRDGEGNYLKDGTNVSFNIGGIIYNSQVIGDNGHAGVDLVLNQGRYIITSYNSVSGENVSSSIAIDLKDVGLVLFGDEISVGENATITVILPVDAAGNVQAEIEGKNYLSKVNVGQALITIPGLTAGNYTAHVTYSGDYKYNGATGNVNVNVRKVDASIVIDDSVITVGENATVSVTLPGDAFGNVRISNEIVPVKNGFASAILTGLKVGITTIPVTYSGDDKYNPIETSADIVVNDKPAPDRKNLTIKANGDEITEGEDAVINVTGLESATGDVSVIIHGKTYTAPIKNGGATVTVSGITENATAYVNYAGDKNYNPTSTSVKIMVNPAPKPVKKNLTIHANAEPITVGEDANVIVTGLKDATGDVSLIVNGRTYTSPIMNGGASITVSGLKENAAGKVSYPGDDNYNGAHTTVVIVVNPLPDPGKKNLTIKAGALPITVGEDANVIVAGLEGATGDVSVTVDGKLYSASIRSGEATVTVSGMTENATAYVNYVGDDNYNPASASVKITVNPAPKPVKKDLTLHANAEPITVGEDVNVIVTGLKDATGDVYLIVNGRTYTSPILNGEARIIVSGLKENSVGQILYLGDDNYNNASASVVIVVNPLPDPGKKNLTIKADALPITVGENATVKVTGLEGATGDVSVTVDGKIFTAPIRDGEATVTVSGITENVTAYVDYVGDDNYNPASASVKITVYPAPKPVKKDLTLHANAEPITVGEDAVVIVTGLKDATGDVSLIVNGRTYTSPIRNGEASVIVSGLKETITAQVSYPGDDNYNNASASVVIVVNPLPDPGKKNLTIKSDADPITVGENATVIVTGLDNATGDVSVIVDGKIFASPIRNGEATVTVSGITENVTAYVDYVGDKNYNPASASVKITVKPKEHATISINAPDVTKYFKGPERFVVTVTDYKGNPLANKSVAVVINGVKYARTTNANGTCSIALNLPANVYNVTTTVDNATTNSVVTILTTVNGTDLVKVFRNATQYYATFRNSEGKYLAEGSVVRFNINGVMYDRKVNALGLAKLNINLEAGKYIITAINTVTGEMSSNNITVIPRIIENSDLTKYYRNATHYTVKIIGDDGKAVGAGESVTFNINGVFYTRQTNASGIVKLNINLEAGDYIITAEYKNCRVSNNIKVLSVLTAKDLVKKYGAPDQFVTTLVDGQGKAYAGQTVTFNINGVFYNRVTESSGQAKLNIRLMAGEYIITSSYNGCNIANKITIRG